MNNAKLWFVLLAALMILSACADPAGVGTVPPAETEAADAESTQETDAEAEAEEPAPEAEPTETLEPYAAIVDGQVISLEEYERQVASYEASMVAAGQDLTSEEGKQALAQGQMWVLDMMVEQVLIEKAAAVAGVTVSDEELQNTLDTLLADIGQDAFDTWLAEEGLSLDEMKVQLRGDMIAMQMTNQIAEAVPAMALHVHARHILTATDAEAQNLRNQILAGADFGEMARAWSQDYSTRDIGGDLGFFPKGILTTSAVEEVAFALQPGQVGEVIQSELGFHIVQVVEIVPDQEVSPDNLYILRQNAVQVWLEGLRAAADIQIAAELTP